jgi:hypothetical protein
MLSLIVGRFHEVRYCSKMSCTGVTRGIVNHSHALFLKWVLTICAPRSKQPPRRRLTTQTFNTIGAQLGDYSGSRSDTYFYIFKFIRDFLKNKNLDLTPNEIVCDFEEAIHIGAKLIWPHINVKISHNTSLV